MSEEKRAELRQKVRELRGLVTGEKAQQICADMERLIEQLSFITTTTVIGSIPPKPWIVY
jgi:CHASE3 domain sensor protein